MLSICEFKGERSQLISTILICSTQLKGGLTKFLTAEQTKARADDALFRDSLLKDVGAYSLQIIFDRYHQQLTLCTTEARIKLISDQQDGTAKLVTETAARMQSDMNDHVSRMRKVSILITSIGS